MTRPIFVLGWLRRHRLVFIFTLFSDLLWWKCSLLIFLLLASNHCQLSLLSILRIPAKPHSYLSSFLEVIIPAFIFKAAHTIGPISCLLR